MSSMFSDRISDVPRSFIREILKVAVDPSVISFAGGLPNRELFPEGDDVIMEEPGYLGAIQAFSVYRSRFNPVPVSGQGMDVDRLRGVLRGRKPKLLYAVPNFQNPSGISYPDGNREEVAEAVMDSGVLLIEDDPYGDLRYTGNPRESFRSLIPGSTVLLGSFSKTVAPGLRLGWIAAPDRIMDKLVIAKQATDLHTSGFAQKVLLQYLRDNDLERHIAKISKVYDSQRRAMIRCIAEPLPGGISHTTPEGGMFLWLTLPGDIPSMDLFHLAIQEKVAFVPGDPFYVDGRSSNSMRLNFSCVDEGTIEEGMRRLGASVEKLMNT